MSAVVAAMVTAIVGVMGTLFAPWMAHRVASRQRLADAETEDRRRNFEDRRAAYVAMNRASRQFHTLLKDALHRLRDGVYTDHERAELEQARLEYRDRYAEAQLIAAEVVLAASRDLNTVMAEVDAVVKRVDRNLSRDGESAEVALVRLKDAEPKLADMVRIMRRHLGTQD
jgi:hypothetical protein